MLAKSLSGCLRSVTLSSLYPILPCPVKHVITGSHLLGMPRDGLPPQIHIRDGARGPLVVTKAMNGTRMHREVRPRPGGFVTERDRSQGRAATNDAADRKAANATGTSTADVASEKEAVKRRLGELHRLLNSRKGRFHATYGKNTENKRQGL